MIEHRNAVNFTAHWQKAHDIGADDRLLQFASINFDAAVADIFPALLSGACLHIAADEIRKDPEQLLRYLQAQSITGALIMPAVLSVMPRESVPSLKGLTVGGDVCDEETLKFWRQGRNLINAYGPTEITVCCNECVVAEGTPYNEIGRPVTNATCYVLDESRRPVPEGESGELYVGGAGVGRGYLNRAELTAERFIANPFTTEDERRAGRNLRLYRTGDLVRRTETGSYLFLGRADSQVKIRGFRVEPGEIEGVLAAHSSVHACAVTAYDHAGEKRLAAYFVMVPGAKPDLASLRAHLAAQLPDYMMPSVFIPMESLPLSPNSKIDRRALPPPTPQDLFADRSNFVAPTSPTQKVLAEIWAELLKTDRVGINDSFFDLGGNSLLTVRMLGAVKKRLGVAVDVAQMLAQPTIASLAAQIDGTAATGADSNLSLALKDAQTEIRPTWNQDGSAREPHSVLLTGVTGFLGLHLAESLLAETKAEVHCLVRGATEADARAKFARMLERSGKGRLTAEPRLRVLHGDLEAPGLGLTGSTRETLTGTLDAIYHCGALVHHMFDYGRLRLANVQSTLDLMRIAATGRRKAFHFISTLGTAMSRDDQGWMIEVDPHDTPVATDGYDLGKWVCERCLERAAGNGMDVNIFRPGNITGESETGFCRPETNHLLLLLKGCVQMKAAPDWLSGIEFTPVDVLAQAIVRLSLSSGGFNIFNMHNPRQLSWREYLDSARRAGVDVAIVPESVWREQYLARIDETNALYPLRAFYTEPAKTSPAGSWPPFARWNAGETQAKLKALDVHYPSAYDEHIRKVTAYLKRTGFLPDLR